MNDAELQALISAPDFDPEQLGARFWFEAYRQHQQQLVQVQAELEELKEKLNKLTQRSSENSSEPPSQDGYKKPSKGFGVNPGQKRGPKYDHRGTTRNGFERVDAQVELPVEQCPACGGPVEPVVDAPVRRHQVAELVAQLVVVTEYERVEYQCRTCGWQGYAPLPLGLRGDFSYGAMLSSLVGWLGYGGHLSWAKQRYVVETIFYCYHDQIDKRGSAVYHLSTQEYADTSHGDTHCKQLLFVAYSGLHL